MKRKIGIVTRDKMKKSSCRKIFISALAAMAMAAVSHAAEVVADFATLANYGTTWGYIPGIDPVGGLGGLPDGSSTTHTFSFDISSKGLGGDPDTLEILVTCTTNLTNGGQNGITAKGGGSDLWWDQGENLSFEVKVKKLGQDITGYYSVDLTGAALRWSTATTASIAGETIGGSGGTAVYTSNLASGETNETSFTAARLEAGGVCQFSQLRFDIVNTATLPALAVNVIEAVANFGTDATLNSQGFAGGYVPASLPGGVTANYTFVYDISTANLTGAATLEVDVTSQTAANIKATAFGFAVEGGVNDLWWDAGEDVDIEIRVLDATGTDVSRFFGVDLTGFSTRWVDRDLDANPATKVTATVAGESFDATTAVAIRRFDLAAGETNEFSFSALRAGDDDICQFSQVRLVITNTVPLPAPFDAATEPGNLLSNGDFSQVTSTGPGFSSGIWRVTGSNGDFPAYDGYPYANVTGWTHYFEDPHNLASYTDAGEVLDGTDKLSCIVNTNSGWVALNSSWDYRCGMVAEDALNGILLNPKLTYVFSIDARKNTAKNHTNNTFRAALTLGSGTDATNISNAISGSLVTVSPTTTLPTSTGTPYTMQVSGADLMAGQVNVMFDSLNTIDFTAGTSWPDVGSVDPQAGDEMSQMFVDNVSLTFIPGAGDVNKDGFLTQDDLDLANLYLAGDGGDTAAVRQSQLISAGYSGAEALGYLRLTIFDVDGDSDFDADDMAALEALIPPMAVQATLNGTVIDLSWNSLPGRVYDLQSRTDLVFVEWAPYEGNTNMAFDASGTNSVTGIPVSDPTRFFRVIEK